MVFIIFFGTLLERVYLLLLILKPVVNLHHYRTGQLKSVTLTPLLEIKWDLFLLKVFFLEIKQRFSLILCYINIFGMIFFSN